MSPDQPKKKNIKKSTTSSMKKSVSIIDTDFKVNVIMIALYSL